MDTKGLVDDYLRRVEREALRLTPGQAADLVGEVREHIDAALAEAGRRDEATVRTVLDQLGAPEAIVAADSGWDGAAVGPAVGSSRVMPGSVVRGSGWGANEIGAILLITIGAILLPVVGPLLGLVFVWASRQWARPAKIVATAIAIVFFAVPLELLLTSLASFSLPPPR